MKTLFALASFASLALVSSLQSQDFSACLKGHSFDTCHYAMNR